MMSDFPMGGMPSYSPNLPPYIHFDQQSATGSTDSFRTQVPLPFYLTGDGQPQDPNSLPQIMSPWATPDAHHSRVMAPFQGSSKSLNPASSPYVPSGYFPQPPVHAQDLRAPYKQANDYPQDGSISVSSSQSFRHGSQISQMTSYQNNNPYGPQASMLGGPVGGGVPSQFQQQHYRYADPYGQIATAAAQHPSYISGARMYNANSAASFSPMYPPLHAAQHFLGMPYPSGVGTRGINQSWGTSFSDPNMHNSQGMGSTGTLYNVQGPGNDFNTAPSSSYNNQNQGSSQYNSRDSSSASLQSKQSHIGSGKASGYNGKGSREKCGLSGQVLAPLTQTAQAVRTPSPIPSGGKIRRHSKSQNRPHLEVKDTKSNLEMPPTPGSRPRPLGVQFSSEPRKLETPHLRSRRGQSVTSNDTFHKSVVDWLENTPTVENLTLRDTSDGRCRASPPKMMSLLAANNVTTSNLKTINENDPFSGGPSALTGIQHTSDPFAPMKAVVPYSNPSAGLARHNNAGMSVQLRNLTSNGTRKPTIAEALDSKNLPFAEICRLAKEDNWGVIKIKNVSCSVLQQRKH